MVENLILKQGEKSRTANQQKMHSVQTTGGPDYKIFYESKEIYSRLDHDGQSDSAHGLTEYGVKNGLTEYGVKIERDNDQCLNTENNLKGRLMNSDVG